LACGHFEALKWARENGCGWDYQTTDAAAVGGHLTVLKWLKEHGCPMRAETSRELIKVKAFKVLTWWAENKCAWDEWVCFYAAGEGLLPTLKWA